MTGNTATPPPEGLQPIGPYIRAAAQAVAFLRRNPREQAGTGPLPEWLDQASVDYILAERPSRRCLCGAPDYGTCQSALRRNGADIPAEQTRLFNPGPRRSPS